MKNLAEQLQKLQKREQQAWEIYSKSVTTQVNRLLESMGSPKDFTMNDMGAITESNKVHNYASCTVSDKALAYATVSRYTWVRQCRERWTKALKEYFDLEKEIKEAQALIK